jgi:hypothetical protein
MRELQSVLHEVSNTENQCGGALLSYAGPLNPKSNEALIILSESAIVQCGYPRIEMLRAKSVVTECLQNVMRHGFIDENGETLLYLTLECTGQGLKVKCGNFVGDDMGHTLKAKIDEVNGLSQSELRKRSIELLCKSETPSKGNPGLGLINIGLNSITPLSYTLEQNNSLHQLFTLTLFVDDSKA